MDGAPSARPPPQGQGEAAAAAAGGGGRPTSADSARRGEQSQTESCHHVRFRTHGLFTTNCAVSVIERRGQSQTESRHHVRFRTNGLFTINCAVSVIERRGQSQTESCRHVGFRTNRLFTTNCPCCCAIEREPPWEGLLLPFLYAFANVSYLVLVCEIVCGPQAL